MQKNNGEIVQDLFDRYYKDESEKWKVTSEKKKQRKKKSHLWFNVAATT